MMTKDSNGTHNERLMVFVRVRPMESSVDDGARAVTVMNAKTLAFVEPADKGDPDVSRSRASLNSTARASRHNSQKFQPVEGKLYQFDGVFDESAMQDEVYENTAAPLVRSVLEGFYATVFAYGATGSGKTHTMIGTPGNPGVMTRAVADIFRLCANGATEYGSKAEVYLSYLEIYNEQIRDLLNPTPGVHLELREDREQVHVAGLSEVKATSANEVLSLLHKGNKARTMEATAANTTSSRSHAVLMVTVRQISMKTGEILDGKLYLIDLAGSERASQTKNSGIRLREGGHINRSLLALGNCITALASGTGVKYINYRDSKLTRLLKAALGGPSKTAMIAHVSPTFLQRDETRNTLLYAQRARTISNRVRKFVYPGHHAETSMMIQELRNEVKRLQTKLRSNNNSKESSEESMDSPTSIAMMRSGAGVKGLYRQHVDDDYRLETGARGVEKRERPELRALKSEITRLFDDEFTLRNDLLKLDGAMLQSALDCEILRLMVLDWENLKTGNNSDGEGSLEESELGNPEIQSVMSELKQVRQEQDRLLQMRSDAETKLILVRDKIAQVEEEASHYLPELQREVLSLLCKLQQDQLSKVSVEIEAELKRRGSLLLRCLRQKALGEAIIHRQRHFLNAISGSYPKTTVGGGGGVDSIGLGDSTIPSIANQRDRDTFLPPLTNGKMTAHNNNEDRSPSSSDRMSATPPEKPVNGMRSSAAISRRGSPTRQYGYPHQHQYFPPLSGTPSAIPKTTKYSDFRKAQANNTKTVNRMMRMKSSSEENLDDRASPTRYFMEGRAGPDVYGTLRPTRKQSSSHSHHSSSNIPYPLSY
ncbi:Kinesin-like protein KIF19 [Orchesella cincta]|uniref:Kinesin-like protein n=1 Tax=Orchesella cincta TaxID=48709 RepID=A0A1D2MVK5_ORCCI|nr:Kinesin-like protein KIF19 [Orchesella cincta]